MCSSFNDKNVELIQFSMPLNPKGIVTQLEKENDATKIWYYQNENFLEKSFISFLI